MSAAFSVHQSPQVYEHLVSKAYWTISYVATKWEFLRMHTKCLLHCLSTLRQQEYFSLLRYEKQIDFPSKNPIPPVPTISNLGQLSPFPL
jgi:hypothetical protein